jgi:hypothetical protein
MAIFLQGWASNFSRAHSSSLFSLSSRGEGRGTELSVLEVNYKRRKEIMSLYI